MSRRAERIGAAGSVVHINQQNQMKVHESPRSGKRGNVVAFRSRFGQCERAHNPLTKRPTAAQRRAQSDFADASLGWNTLTDEQREAWHAYGRKVRSHPRGGQSGPLTGQNLYILINRNQKLLGLPPLVYPPERPAFGPNPVSGLTITGSNGGVALTLSVANAPAGDVLIFASRPYNAGRRFCDKFTYLGTLPPPRAGNVDITVLYLRRHAPPWPGSRVFLLVTQQINGWRDIPQRIQGVFRAGNAPLSLPKRRRAAASAREPHQRPTRYPPGAVQMPSRATRGLLAVATGLCPDGRDCPSGIIPLAQQIAEEG
jgi:hypothetical protein